MKTFALAGNPNCGKTTLFNSLTGSTAHVGNWPGVTVDKRDGVYKKGSEPCSIIDLPGIYSLSPYTPEEVISRNYILDENPDCVINIVDATNLERNLYLTTQIMEMDVPMVIALNMMDTLKKNGESVDTKTLSEKLGVPVVEISALKEENLDVLMEEAIKASNTKRQGETVLKDSDLAHLIGDTRIAFEGIGVKNPLFHAVKLVELDEIESANHPDLLETVKKFKATFNDDTFGSDFEAIVADARYKFISKNFKDVKTATKPKEELTKSDKIDRVLTNKWAGIPIFLLILFVIFHLTFSENLFYLGGLFADATPSFAGSIYEGALWSDAGIASPGVFLQSLVCDTTDWFSGVVAGWLENAPAWVSGFVVDGVLAGLFSVLSFVPQILLLFLFFSILEDSGYMARVAFILDRIFRKFGLSGRAFMPMIMGFGCSVPAMINTRTLADDKERTSTIRVIPFFSCGAKLPILVAISGAICTLFGFNNTDVITYSMYLVGMVAAIVAIIVMRKTTLKGEVPPFIMELPAYHAPQFKSLMIHLWDKLKHFIKKAFTIILVSTIIIWFLSNLAIGSEFGDIEHSLLAYIGKGLQWIFTPVGFGLNLKSWGWVFAVAAITGLIAKENVIATFASLAACIIAVDPTIVASTLEAIEEDEDGILAAEAMLSATGMDWAGAISFIVFNMTTIPCFAAVATAKAELPKGKFWSTIGFWLLTSYLTSGLVYTFLKPMACGASYWWTELIFVALIALIVGGVILYNKVKAKKAAKKA